MATREEFAEPKAPRFIAAQREADRSCPSADAPDSRRRTGHRHRLRSTARWRLGADGHRHQRTREGRGRCERPGRADALHPGGNSARRLRLRRGSSGDDVQPGVHAGHDGRATEHRRSPRRRDPPACRRGRVRARRRRGDLRPADGLRRHPPADAQAAAAERHDAGCAHLAAARRRLYQRGHRHHPADRSRGAGVAPRRRVGVHAGQHPSWGHALGRRSDAWSPATRSRPICWSCRRDC